MRDKDVPRQCQTRPSRKSLESLGESLVNQGDLCKQGLLTCKPYPRHLRRPLQRPTEDAKDSQGPCYPRLLAFFSACFLCLLASFACLLPCFACLNPYQLVSFACLHPSQLASLLCLLKSSSACFLALLASLLACLLASLLALSIVFILPPAYLASKLVKVELLRLLNAREPAACSTPRPGPETVEAWPVKD